MDLATAQSYLNNPKYAWEKLRHLQPFLLNAVRNKNMKVVAAFLNHKLWGDAYCSKDTIETMAHSHWKDGWDLLSSKCSLNDTTLELCLAAARANPELFQSTLDQFWKAYADVSPRSKKIRQFIAGVHKIQLAAIRFNDCDLYHLCKNAYASHNISFKNSDSTSLIDAARKHMCCWAVDDLMRSSGQPLHHLQSFLYIQSFMVEDNDLLKLCRTLLEVSTSPETERTQLVNALFTHKVVERPIFNQLCKEIDQLRLSDEKTVYSADIFYSAVEAHCKGNMEYTDALYWCAKVWQQRIDQPATGSSELYTMLGRLLVESAKSNNWALVKTLSQQFSDTYEILVKHVFNGTLETYGGNHNTIDQILHNVDDATDLSIAKSSYTTTAVDAYREKLRLQHAVGASFSVKRGKKI